MMLNIASTGVTRTLHYISLRPMFARIDGIRIGPCPKTRKFYFFLSLLFFLRFSDGVEDLIFFFEMRLF